MYKNLSCHMDWTSLIAIYRFKGQHDNWGHSINNYLLVTALVKYINLTITSVFRMKEYLDCIFKITKKIVTMSLERSYS